MQIHSIETGYFKLDGGAMFGVVPKSIWSRSNPADSNNLCTFAMRCLLVKDGNRLILIDTGLGEKQSEQFFKHYYLHGDDTLQKSIEKAGYSCDEVTDVILTHLHFDHVGGAVTKNTSTQQLETKFKNAKYWSNKKHWDWATNPNPREKASFLSENILPIQEAGQLHFIETGKELGSNFNFLTVHGHTESQIIPHITYGDKTIIFAADLVPTVTHIPLPYVMSYDTRPLLSMTEKEGFLKTSFDNNCILFLQHDPINECCNLMQSEKGIRVNEKFKLSEIG